MSGLQVFGYRDAVLLGLPDQLQKLRERLKLPDLFMPDGNMTATGRRIYSLCLSFTAGGATMGGSKLPFVLVAMLPFLVRSAVRSVRRQPDLKLVKEEA